MSGPIFVLDAAGTPLMPMAAAHARKLVKQGRASFIPHYVFSVLQLNQTIDQPTVRPVVLVIDVRYRTAEIQVFAEGAHTTHSLLRVLVDLATDLPRRLRRRAGHRRRRRSRRRYRAMQRYNVPHKLRRPSLARSSWRRTVRRRHLPLRNRRQRTSPTIQWRAEAIIRVVNALRRLLPISHIVIKRSLGSASFYGVEDQVDRREAVIRRYAHVQTDGSYAPRCAYCGRPDLPIVVDHILPRSRGGTNALENLAPACEPCNQRKGDKTPQEAGMRLARPKLTSNHTNRQRAYVTQTNHLLSRLLRQQKLRTVWLTPHDTTPPLPEGIAAHIRVASPEQFRQTVIARPIARPRKQVYAARAYSSTTPLRSPLERVKGVIRRRIRVNHALAIFADGLSPSSQILRRNAQVTRPHRLIRLGLFCEGRRAGSLVRGVVSAIHSSGRLTLLVPQEITPERIHWHRVIIVPALHIRVLSSDGVIFFRLPKRYEPEA